MTNLLLVNLFANFYSQILFEIIGKLSDNDVKK